MPRYNAGARYNYLGSTRYNLLQVLTLPPALYQRLPHAKPVVLDESGRRVAVLENAYDIVLTQEINGEDTLAFKLPPNDPKRFEIVHERRVQLVDQFYVIRRVRSGRDEDGSRFIEVHCEAEWYDLMFADPLPVSQWQDALASTVLGDILKGTGWQVGTVEITARRNLQLDEKLMNRLQALRQVAEVWGGELQFDTAKRTVSLLRQVGRKTPVAAFVYRKNLRNIQREVDTLNLITRLYPYGAKGLTIAAANNGLPYLEDFQYTTRIRAAAIKDERFTNPWHLKEKAQEILAQVSKPRVSYTMRAADLSALAELQHEDLGLGDVVRVYDQELDIDIETRILRWQYSVDRPWDTELELSSTQPGLEDLISQIDDTATGLEQADYVDRQELQEMMVFNYLVNSRADNGFAGWVNNGWEIDNENGYSGPASFKCVGQYGVSKVLSQRVWPAHRDAYTLSFRVATENLQPGPAARVGVEVIIRYKDGSSETKWLSIL